MLSAATAAIAAEAEREALQMTRHKGKSTYEALPNVTRSFPEYLADEHSYRCLLCDA